MNSSKNGETGKIHYSKIQQVKKLLLDHTPVLVTVCNNSFNSANFAENISKMPADYYKLPTCFKPDKTWNTYLCR